MIIPVRCFSCGKEISSQYATYVDEVNDGTEPEEVFKRLDIARPCCKRMFLTHVEIANHLIALHKGG